jgi:hypothetical protein
MALFLRAHQAANLNYFRTKARAFTLLRYGAGKTPILIRRLADLVPPHRALIVTTVGTIYKWARELEKWGDPHWRTTLLIGKRDKRRANFASPHNVAIINYEGLRVMIKALGKQFLRFYNVVVFDEIHRVKNPNSNIAKDAALIAHPEYSDYVYAATGSPVLESPLDLFSLMRVVVPSVFGQNYERWREAFFDHVPVPKPDGSLGFPKWRAKPGAVEYLKRRLHAVSFQCRDEDLDLNYPDQKFTEPFTGKLTGVARRKYVHAEKKFELVMRHANLPLENVYSRMEKLCQLSRGWAYTRGSRAYETPGAPGIISLAEYLESIGHGRLVIWAVRDPDFEMISGLLERMSRPHRMVNGSIRNLKKRDEVVDSFNAGTFDVLVAHPKCIGEGQDLAANYSFRYSYRWSALEWDQPIGRFARMTSGAQFVHYTDYMTEGTIDEGIVAAIGQKQDIGNLIKKTKRLPWKLGAAGALRG